MGQAPRSRSGLRKYISRFPQKRLLVVGDFMLDQFIRGNCTRISPEAPVPVVKVAQEIYMPGGAGNVATNLAALGAQVSIIGLAGPDEAGRRLASDLSARRIDVKGLLTDERRVTSQKCRVIAEHQQVVRVDRETAGPPSAASIKQLLKLLSENGTEADAVVLSDYGKGVVSQDVIDAAIALASRRRIPVTVDPKVEHFKRYKGVTCMTPNTQEAWAGMGRLAVDGQEPIEALGQDILSELACESVLITRGAQGMSLFEKGKRPRHIPTQAREVFDVTGAGDTVIAVMTLALASGADVAQAAVIANAAAGIVVGKLGTATTNVDELAAAVG